jgi:hypothetical protein
VYSDFIRVIVGVAPDARNQLGHRDKKLGREREKEESKKKKEQVVPFTFQISTPIVENLTGPAFVFFPSLFLSLFLSLLTLPKSTSFW